MHLLIAKVKESRELSRSSSLEEDIFEGLAVVSRFYELISFHTVDKMLSYGGELKSNRLHRGICILNSSS